MVRGDTTGVGQPGQRCAVESGQPVVAGVSAFPRVHEAFQHLAYAVGIFVADNLLSMCWISTEARAEADPIGSDPDSGLVVVAVCHVCSQLGRHFDDRRTVAGRIRGQPPMDAGSERRALVSVFDRVDTLDMHVALFGAGGAVGSPVPDGHLGWRLPEPNADGVRDHAGPSGRVLAAGRVWTAGGAVNAALAIYDHPALTSPSGCVAAPTAAH